MNKLSAAIAALFALSTAAFAAEPISGEVRKIDEAAGKITLKHGPAKSLGMAEPMTMVYRIKDPAMLKTVKAGDSVAFEAEQSAAGFTVTKIEKVK